MKSLFTFLVVLLLITQTFGIQGGSSEKVVSDNTIKSLIEGLESGNLGLKTSCAYQIGELKITGAIIPLMKLLRSDECEEVRICAALAFYKIGTPMSIYAVKQASRYDESERVVKLTYGFYNEYLRNKLSTDENIKDSTYVAAN